LDIETQFKEIKMVSDTTKLENAKYYTEPNTKIKYIVVDVDGETLHVNSSDAIKGDELLDEINKRIKAKSLTVKDA
tara:strand:- start:56 stop:283 length:228 start_codon:yes stop_codon:yes gene_type:complete